MTVPASLGATPAVLHVPDETPAEDVRNALTMLEQCGHATQVGTHIYASIDYEAIRRRLIVAIAKLETLRVLNPDIRKGSGIETVGL